MAGDVPGNDFAANQTFHKKQLPIEGLYKNRAARVSPIGEFANIDRKWRAQFLKDRSLTEADMAMYQVK
jgi:hypothetical protein